MNCSGVTISLSTGRLKVADAPSNGYGAYYPLNTVMTAGRTYKLKFTVDLNSSGAVTVGVATRTLAFANKYCSSNGTYELICTPTTTTGLNWKFTSSVGTVRDFYIDNLELEDITVNGYMADIRQSTDYSPFGVILHNRDLPLTSGSGTSVPYRYGFQNQERDDEIKGAGNSINFEYRMHDPRLGRFFAIDPLAPDYPWNSPYAFSENIVINAVELEGLEKVNTFYYNYETKSFPKKPDSKSVDNSLNKNINVYVYGYPNGGVKRTVVKSWDKTKVASSYGSMDPQLLHSNFGSISISASKSADKTHYDSWEGGAEAGNEDESWSGEKGLKEKGIPLMVATVATIFSGGTLAGASSGYAITWGTAGLVSNTDELTRFFSDNSKTVLENLAHSIGGDKGVDVLKGAKLAMSVRSASNSFVNLTVLLADGKTYSGVYDLTKNIFTLGKTGTKITQTATKETKTE